MKDTNGGILRLKDVGAYIKEKIGVNICRATIYNWTTNGRIAYDGRRVLLRTAAKCPIRTTTEEWVDEFLKEFQDEE